MTNELLGRDLLAAWLAERAVSQADVARAMGVSNVAVHNWIKGMSPPSDVNRRRLERWTGGAVPTVSWLSPDERAEIEAMPARQSPVVGSAEEAERPSGIDCPEAA